MPYLLVYEIEATLPIELEVSSLRVLKESQLSKEKWNKERYEELLLLDKRCLQALYCIQRFQRRNACAFNRRVKGRGLKEVDLVLKEIKKPFHDSRGKFHPN